MKVNPGKMVAADFPRGLHPPLRQSCYDSPHFRLDLLPVYSLLKREPGKMQENLPLEVDASNEGISRKAHLFRLEKLETAFRGGTPQNWDLRRRTDIVGLRSVLLIAFFHKRPTTSNIAHQNWEGNRFPSEAR
jgi:hypothetical protein